MTKVPEIDILINGHGVSISLCPGEAMRSLETTTI